jgi:anaerobic ribonucleoside-triphosphate reductase
MDRNSVSLVGRTILAETPDSITVSGTYQSPRLTVGITAITEQLSRCQHCGKTFPQQHKRTMYCSPTCRIRQKHVQRKASGYYVRRRARLKAAREQRTRLGKTWLRNLRTLWWGGSSSKRTMDK